MRTIETIVLSDFLDCVIVLRFLTTIALVLYLSVTVFLAGLALSNPCVGSKGMGKLKQLSLYQWNIYKAFNRTTVNLPLFCHCFTTVDFHCFSSLLHSFFIWSIFVRVAFSPTQRFSWFNRVNNWSHNTSILIFIILMDINVHLNCSYTQTHATYSSLTAR